MKERSKCRIEYTLKINKKGVQKFALKLKIRAKIVSFSLYLHVQLKKHIPNLFTLGNMLCGCLAIIACFSWDFQLSALLIFLGAVFDFFDGFLARLLKVSGDLGKQLDSLADMVTFGLAPGIIVFQLLRFSLWTKDVNIDSLYPMGAFIAMLIPLLSGYRLAKFNIDTRQSDSFIGLPTPANALFFSSIAYFLDLKSLAKSYEFALLQFHQTPSYKLNFSETTFTSLEIFLFSPGFLISSTIIFSFLLIAELPLLALKFKQFGFKGNEWRYSLLGLSALLLIIFQVSAIPIIVVLYILISILNNTIKSHEIQS